MKGTDKFLAAIVIGVILLVGIALIVILVKPEPTYLEENSPEGVAHNYLLALEKEEYERAYSYLSTRLKSYPENTEDFVDDIGHYAWRFRSGRDTTLAVDSTKISGNRAIVTVRETTFYERGLFESSQSISTFKIDLDLENGQWRITDADYYFAYCWKSDNSCR